MTAIKRDQTRLTAISCTQAVPVKRPPYKYACFLTNVMRSMKFFAGIFKLAGILVFNFAGIFKPNTALDIKIGLKARPRDLTSP